MQSEYSAFRNKAQQDYNDFRKKANEDYARFMERTWEEMRVFKGEEPPRKPKPIRQPVAVPDRMPPSEPVPLPTPEVVPLPERVPPPAIAPDEMIDELPMPEPQDPTVGMTFYGKKCDLHIDATRRVVLKAVNEKAAAQAWKELSDGRYDALLRDCLSLCSSMQLGDWGYMELTRQAAIVAMGKAGDEATLLQAWLLSQSGIELRLAKANGHFVLLMVFEEDIYRYSFIRKSNRRFYILDNKNDGKVQVCDMAFPKTHTATLRLQQLPLLPVNNNAQRPFAAKHFATMKADVSVNNNLMSFFDNYPQSNSYNYYVNASLSDNVKQQLYPALRQRLEGKSKKKQVQMLLDFVQTSFDYKTDQEQFGRERSFFGDESFFHPYNDCEDRSILFSILVRELVGLDVVLLVLPHHMATAVCFDSEVPGSYYMVDGRRFTVCDPTYIGAGIGESMSQYKDIKARIVML
ncbi:MAG: hypothetical protein IJ620_03115 [Bacteroidales bacterium]|nr:hypothetical protein [Bacteroidales bacterium]